LFLSFLFSLFAFYEVALVGCFVYLKLATWISSEVLNVDWGFMFDSLTVSMCVVVTFISFLVHLYSTEYMSHDPHLPRFMAYLSLFTFFMLILVTADSARLAQGLRSEMLLYRNLEIKINMSFSCRLI